MGKVLRHLAVCGVLVLGAVGCKSNNSNSYPTTGSNCSAASYPAGASTYPAGTTTYPAQGGYQQPGTATSGYGGMSGYPASGAGGAGYPAAGAMQNYAGSTGPAAGIGR